MASCRIELSVQPKAGQERVEWRADGTLRVTVTAAAENGKANDAVVALLAAKLGLPKRDVRITQGLSARRKVVEVELSIEEVRHALGAPSEL
ncbi:MAG: DUF167 domain-containing protein [Chloroflexi bacterium]|nr:DUF167 domain-containing protein [Chloroflexota bacterium]